MEDTPDETIIDDSGSGSVSELLTLSRHARLWLVPVLVALAAIVGSWIAVGAIESAFQQTLEKKLRAIVASTANSVALWSEQQTLNARILAEDDRTERLVARLLMSDEPQVRSNARSELAERLEASSFHFGFSSFTVIDATGETLVSNSESNTFDESQINEFSQVFCGETVFAEPALSSDQGTDLASFVYVAAPIQSRRGDETLATLVCQIPSDGHFRRTLEVSNFGETGLNFAIDRTGQPLVPGASKQIPLTQILLAKIDEFENSVVLDANGYADETGKRFVGGAQWLPDFGIGVVSTIDYDEAYASHNLFKNINAFVTAIALLGSIIGLVYTWYLSRAQLRAMKAERKLRKLGQYSLEEKVGEGGMGEVYRATHRMLRRPTAVKLLPAGKSSPQAIERFEREVQLTSQLTHPNTISIYDYGRTADGVFYYAMEYLDGIDLKKLVELEGAQPEARVVHILAQICGSLEEAHKRSLVHRDIKPANVILCQRGGRFDVAKLLDFGLVYDAKCLRASMEGSGINGTPAFMSPEAIESPAEVDHRSDIYSIGAVAYFLLTGTYTFTGSTTAEIWERQLSGEPLSPSIRTSEPISGTLEELVMRCLAIDPKRRPQSIAELQETLAELRLNWSQEQAEERSTAEKKTQGTMATLYEEQLAETLAYAG